MFNRTVGLRDTWDKQAPKAAPSEPTTKEAKVAVAPASARSDERARPVKASKTEIKHKLLAQSPEAQALALELADAGKLSEEDAELVATDATLSELYLSAKAAHARVDMLATWLVNDIQRELRSRDGDIGQFTGEKLSELLTLVESGELTSVLAKEVLGETWTSKESPREVVLRCGLSPIRDPEAIVELLRAAMAQSPKQVAAFRAGNVKLAGYFVGQVMKASSGRADPQVVQSVVSQHLAQEAGVP